jgi:hypothetical protein
VNILSIRNSEGSALLFVLIISFTFLLLSIRWWKISGQRCDIQYQRELFYRRFYITQRICDVGINLACKNFDRFLQLKKAMKIDLGSCLTDREIASGNIAQLTVSKCATVKDCLLISVALIQGGEFICNIRCLLDRKIGAENNEAKTKRIYFAINNYTLGSSL